MEAVRAGISPDRLFVTRLMPRVDMFRAKSFCSVYLDTYPYGSHSTAGEAIYAAIPIIVHKPAIPTWLSLLAVPSSSTCVCMCVCVSCVCGQTLAGDTVPSRIAASAMVAAGVTETVVTSLAAYGNAVFSYLGSLCVYPVPPARPS